MRYITSTLLVATFISFGWISHTFASDCEDEIAMSFYRISLLKEMLQFAEDGGSHPNQENFCDFKHNSQSSDSEVEKVAREFLKNSLELGASAERLRLFQSGEDELKQTPTFENTVIICDFDETLAYMGLTEQAQKLLEDVDTIREEPEVLVQLGKSLGLISGEAQEQELKDYLSSENKEDHEANGLVEAVVKGIQRSPCVLFSCECQRADLEAFMKAGLVELNIVAGGYIVKRLELESALMRKRCLELHPMEKKMHRLFPKLRDMGAFLAVCSGNPYADSKGELMRRVGFCEKGSEPKLLYVGGRSKNKQSMIIELLQSLKRRFKRLIFIDNYNQNVQGTVRSLCGKRYKQTLLDMGITEVLGVHYDRFHSKYMNVDLLKRQFQLLEKLCYRI